MISANKMHSECNDVRLYARRKQKHWVADNTCNTDSTDIWIKIDELVSGDNQLTLCYGDTTLSDQSNGNETFPIYFDDFVRASDNDFTHPGSGQDYGVTAGKVSLNSGYFKQHSSSGYAPTAEVTISYPGDTYFSIVQHAYYSSVGSGLYQGNRISLTGFSFASYSTNANYHAYSNLPGGSWHSGSGGLVSGGTYLFEVQYHPNKMVRKCLEFCSWDTTRSGSHTISSGDNILQFAGGHSGYSAQFDYMFYRKRIGEGDPTFTIGDEIAP